MSEKTEKPAAEKKEEQKTPPPPRPVSLDVDYQEINPGHYNAIINVGFDHGAASVGLLIIAGKNAPVEKPTGPNGRLVYPIPVFTESEMDFEVQVDGQPELQKKDTLEGPPRPKKKKIGVIAGVARGQGFWVNYKKAVKEESES